MLIANYLCKVIFWIPFFLISLKKIVRYLISIDVATKSFVLPRISKTSVGCGYFMYVFVLCMCIARSPEVRNFSL